MAVSIGGRIRECEDRDACATAIGHEPMGHGRGVVEEVCEIHGGVGLKFERQLRGFELGVSLLHLSPGPHPPPLIPRPISQYFFQLEIRNQSST